MEELLDRLFRGEPAALARAITAVERGAEEGRAVLHAIQNRVGRALLVGFTGPPGAGKSTLVGAYVGELRRRGKSVGVVAVDPASPVSGGALLGDRIRMTAHAGDAGVFIRSLSSAGHLGGLSPVASRIADVMDAAGKDVVILETVGAGQSEVEVAEVADVTVVVAAPALGDDIQAIKSGILEVAQVLVVNKADLPQAAATRQQLSAMLRLSARDVPLVATTATSGAGLSELSEAIARIGERRAPRQPGARLRAVLAQTAARRLRERALSDPAAAELAAAVERGELDLDTAADRLAERLQIASSRAGARTSIS
jgi:LAO/AO transport system kinase